jgi:hypothetical protein
VLPLIAEGLRLTQLIIVKMGYNLSEHLAVNEIIVKFKRSVNFRQHISKKQKPFGTIIFKLCDAAGMKVYLGKDRMRRSSPDSDVCNGQGPLQKNRGVGHELHMDNFFSSPDFFDELMAKKICCCGTVRPNRKSLPQDLSNRRLKMKKGDIRVRVKGEMTLLVWKD